MQNLGAHLCFKKKFIIYLKFTFIDLERKARLQDKKIIYSGS